MTERSKADAPRPTPPNEQAKPPRRDSDPVRETNDPMISGDAKPAGYTNTDEPRDGAKPHDDTAEPQRSGRDVISCIEPG